MTLLYNLGMLLTVGGLSALTIAITGLQAYPRVHEGRRGMTRRDALAESSGFALLEPAVRKVAPLVLPVLSPQRRDPLSHLLERSGYWLGLDALELVTLSTLCGPIGMGLGLLIGESLKMRQLGGILGFALGFALPLLRLSNATLARHKAIGRELPGAIDLAALCMAAGLDFSASIFAIVQQNQRRSSPLIEEFQQILRSLEMGHTRSHALADFARAAPIAAVEEFAAAVTQAEQKGTPLRDVLQVQASTLRMRRSVAAEEAASRAGVMLVFPLLLLMGSVLLILVGPFIVNGFGL